MIRNYFLVAWRNLIKSKGYSVINILGLSLGMTVAMFIAIWIWDELNYNKEFEHYDRIVRVKENSTHEGGTSTFNSIPIPLAGELRSKFASDFKYVSLSSWNQPHILSYGDKKMTRNGMFVEPEFAKIFTLPFIAGSASSLNDPSGLVLTQASAIALFGNEDPLGKIVKVDNKISLTVQGVVPDFAANSQFNTTHFFVPWSVFVADQPWVKKSETNWDNNSFQLFAQLSDAAVLGKVAAKVKGSLEGHDRSDKPEVVLHPMSKWHLYAEFKDGINTGGSIQFVWMFGSIGVFVLLLACINFMNLSTARSEKRAREVGIRKAMGSLRTYLIAQFLAEALLVAMLAFLLALLLVWILMPGFNQLAHKHLHIFWGSAVFWFCSLLFVLITGLLAGSYPAFYLSSFNSIEVLKGRFKAGRLASLPRRVLVVVQFTVSVALIIGTIIVYKEINYAKDRPVGYSRNGLLTVLMNTPDLQGHYSALRNDLLQTGAVANMSEASSPPTEIWNNQSNFDWPGKPPGFVPTFGRVRITHDYGKTVGWETVQGRDFDRAFATDSLGMILNEAAVSYMGLKDPVGKTITHDEGNNERTTFTVIGVVKNIISESPFSPVKPTLYTLDYDDAYVVIVRANPRWSMQRALSAMAGVFHKYNPGAPFEYDFTDEEYAQKFAAEERIGRLAGLFALFAIFISCLGLFGLASFTAEQRTKEIGVRKVLGASALRLWKLLSFDFLWLVFLSLFVAIPLAYYLMSKWLEHYAYRIHISGWIFVAAGMMALTITLVTVSIQAIRAARSNPVRALRSE